MFVDSSALVAIVTDEPDSRSVSERMARGKNRVISTITQVEASIAVGQFHDDDYEFGASQIADFVERAGITVLDVPADIVPEVLTAYRRYGKGAGHRAKLNFGDCFSYAFAKRLNTPILSKGEDFVFTDLEAAP